MYFRFRVEGHDRDGKPYTTLGTVSADDYDVALAAARRESFVQVTGGKAIYGFPGTTCNGPYKVTRVDLEREDSQRQGRDRWAIEKARTLVQHHLDLMAEGDSDALAAKRQEVHYALASLDEHELRGMLHTFDWMLGERDEWKQA
jgi:hypothetical protein